MTSCPIKTKIFYITVIYVHFTCAPSVARNTETLFDKKHYILHVIVDCCFVKQIKSKFSKNLWLQICNVIPCNCWLSPDKFLHFDMWPPWPHTHWYPLGKSLHCSLGHRCICSHWPEIQSIIVFLVWIDNNRSNLVHTLSMVTAGNSPESTVNKKLHLTLPFSIMNW